MRPTFALPALVAALASTLLAVPVRAEGLRVLTSDARGVTLQVDAGRWALSAPRPDGRVVVIGVPLAHSLADPGHGLLPAYATMLAVPTDARPSVRVVSAGATQERTGVRLPIARRPGFRRQGGANDYEPTADDVAPIADGLWPPLQAQLAAPGAFRGRRLVGLEVRPFQYDDATGRLLVTPTMVVRVDFNRPAGAAALPVVATASDPQADAVLGSTVLNFAQARGWRVAPAGTARPLFGARAVRPAGAAAALAFDESGPEVRVRLDSTGVYRLPFDLLAAKGYPAATPIGQVSVHRHEFLEGASVPYGTLELPVEVDDVNNNGVFDSGDQIWLYARTWAERSGASNPQRFWGDGEDVFVTVKTTGGLRMAQRPGWRNSAGPAPVTSYPYQQHWEVNDLNIMPFVTLPSDTTIDLYHWTDFIAYADRPDTITFGVNDIDTTHAVQFRTDLVGRAANTHFVWAQVKTPASVVTTVVDSVYWYGKQENLVQASLHGSALGEGTNRFLDWGKTDPVPYDPVTNNQANVGLNWFEATYWRRLLAVHDRLSFNTAGASGEIQMHLDRFNADTIRVWDVTVPENPVRVVVDPSHESGGALDLQDSLASSEVHRYVATALQSPVDPAYGPMTPPAASFTRVNRLPIYPNTAGDYLMVVPEAFLAAAQPLIALRRSQGLSVVVATAEEMYDEFNGGRHSAAAVQRFANYAYTNWSSRFLLLFGDGTLDPLNHFGKAGPDWVPVNIVPGPVPVSEGYEITVSDNLYGCLTGNRDPIFGSGPVLPDLMVGRLPANTAADAQAMVTKLTGYEDLAGDQSWRLHSMLVSDDAYSSDDNFGVSGSLNDYCFKDYEMHFVGLNEKVRSVMLDEAGLSQMNVEMFNERAYITNPAYYIVNGPLDTCRIARTTIENFTNRSVTPVMFAHLNPGTLWMNFQGHANEYVLTHETLYQNNGDLQGSDDRWNFANDGRPVLWTAFSCHANMFARPEGGPSIYSLGGCLGEDMVNMNITGHPTGGAVASWASSCYEVVPRDDSTHLNVALARALFSNPPNDPLLSGGSRVVLGEAISAAFVRFMPQVQSYPYERGTPLTYTLLGDPATRISIGQPQLIVHANDTLVVDGTPVRLHSPLDTLRLVANLVSTVQLDSIGLFLNEGSGDAPVALAPGDIVPAFPDTVNGGLYGGRRYDVTYLTHLKPETYHYVFFTRDHDGLEKRFTVQFQFDATVRANGAPIHDGDAVAPAAALSIMLVSPAPITPTTQVTLTVNGATVTADATPAPGDASGREWVLSWTHADYAPGPLKVIIAMAGGPTLEHNFNVTTGALKISQMLAFPNPFDNDGTRWSFVIEGTEPSDVRITVMTISGRRIWTRDYRSLPPGYQQIPWDGHDQEGSEIANGTYFYRINASTGSGRHTDQVGRMVKLRKPRHVDLSTTSP